MRIVDLGWVYICAYNFFVSKPKFTSFFRPTRDWWRWNSGH